MRIAALCVVLALAGGCGSRPAEPDLTPGGEAILYSPGGNHVLIGDRFRTAPVGTRVTVVDRRGDRVRVSIREGMHAGEVVTLDRGSLRAVPR
jgi:hypothetical protein